MERLKNIFLSLIVLFVIVFTTAWSNGNKTKTFELVNNVSDKLMTISITYTYNKKRIKF